MKYYMVNMTLSGSYIAQALVFVIIYGAKQIWWLTFTQVFTIVMEIGYIYLVQAYMNHLDRLQFLKNNLTKVK